MQIRIGCMNYGDLESVYRRLEPALSPDVKLIHLQGIFEETVKKARELENTKSVDVFLTSGSNAQLIRENTTLPLVEMVPSGFDILQAIKKTVSGGADSVGLITYHAYLPIIHEVKSILPLRIIERTFNNVQELEQVLDELQSQGVRDIIGGFLSCTRARLRGMIGHNIISENSIKSGVYQAVEVARARNQEIEKAGRWHTILETVHEGVVVTNELEEVLLFNRQAEKIVGLSKAEALGRPASAILPNSRMKSVIISQKAEIDQIQLLGNARILTSRIPITINGKAIGAVATFRTVDDVQKAEQKIRRKTLDSGFYATSHFEDILGNCDVLAQTIATARRYAKSDASVLIFGETGTGKELFAQSIHNSSARRNMPFVSVNCAALPTNLLESELFGYDDGAFTGARRGGKSGLFELAQGGTIFLDEFAEMPLDIQARLLRVIEERQLIRVGGEKIVNINVRFITATNKNLWEMVRTGSFREDLYYRVNVLSLHLPPLRQRREDIPLLLEHFLLQLRPDFPIADLQKVVRQPVLLKYDWLGNIRELRNIAERIAVLYNPDIPVARLMSEIGFAELDPYEEITDEQLLQILKLNAGNRTKTAAMLGIGRTTLWRKMQKAELPEAKPE